MPQITVASSLRRHVDCPGAYDLPGETLKAALDALFVQVPALRGYVLDDQGAVRKHVAVFIDAQPLADRSRLDQPLAPGARVALFQALSGG